MYTHKVSEKALNRSSLIVLVSLARIYCKATVKGPCGAISCPPMNTIDIHKHMHASARIQSRRHLLAAGLACATAASAWTGSCFRFLMRSTRLECRRNTPRVCRQLHPPAQCRPRVQPSGAVGARRHALCSMAWQRKNAPFGSSPFGVAVGSR